MKNRKIEAALRILEHSIGALDRPIVHQMTFHGDLRTLSPTAKVRELENLIIRTREIQVLISEDGQNESHQEWLGCLKQSLKVRLEIAFNQKSNFVFDEIDV